MILRFQGPKSFTGEDTVEIHLHGGPAVVAATLTALENIHDLRAAGAGEFTRRAYSNGKVGLTEVEGLADLIEAETEAQRIQAVRQMRGELANMYNDWRTRLLHALALTEAVIDFADEEEDVGESVVEDAWIELADLQGRIVAHLNDGRRGEILRSGARVALLGPPNAGKSSLLNRLAQRPAAIVSPLAGTTRDVVETSLNIDGLPVVLSDTAGLRVTNDPVEQAGVERARTVAEDSFMKLLVLDASDIFVDKSDDDSSALSMALRVADESTVLVLNKVDLVSSSDIETVVTTLTGKVSALDPKRVVPLSCTRGTGIDALVRRIGSTVRASLLEDGKTVASDEPLLTRERHRRLLGNALQAIETALALRDAGQIEIVAEELRKAAHEIGSITGHVSVDEILDVIFSSFCIGK
eukprot:g495.t1